MKEEEVKREQPRRVEPEVVPPGLSLRDSQAWEESAKMLDTEMKELQDELRPPP